MSSKKKKRQAEWIKREEKRTMKKKAAEKYKEAMESGDIEKTAQAMGIKLK